MHVVGLCTLHRFLRFVDLVQWRHGSIRMEMLVLCLIAPALQNRLVLLYRQTVGVMETSVNRRVEGSTEQITGAVYSRCSALQVVKSFCGSQAVLWPIIDRRDARLGRLV